MSKQFLLNSRYVLPQARPTMLAFRLVIIVVHVVKHQSVINKYMQKAGEPENDAAFLKVKNNCAVHVAS